MHLVDAFFIRTHMKILLPRVNPNVMRITRSHAEPGCSDAYSAFFCKLILTTGSVFCSVMFGVPHLANDEEFTTLNQSCHLYSAAPTIVAHGDVQNQSLH